MRLDIGFVPLWRNSRSFMLIVILRMCSVMEDMDEDQANEVFQQAQASGKAMAGIYPFETAELFKEQLLRSNPMIFADMLEDKN
jgi:ATP-dependent Clp protease adapter protein ClpS